MHAETGIGCSHCGEEVYPEGTTEVIGHTMSTDEDGRCTWTAATGVVVHNCP